MKKSALIIGSFTKNEHVFTGKGLSAFVTPILREYIANEEAAQRAKKS